MGLGSGLCVGPVVVGRLGLIQILTVSRIFLICLWGGLWLRILRIFHRGPVVSAPFFGVHAAMKKGGE